MNRRTLPWNSYKICLLPRLEFNIDFIYQETSFCKHKDTFLKCKITTITVRNFDTILSASVTKEERF